MKPFSHSVFLKNNAPAEGMNLPMQASLLTVFLCTLFGANAVAIKLSFTGIGVFATAGLRFTIAAITIFLWAKLSGKSLRLNKHQFFQLLISSLIFFMQMSGIYLGQNLTTASHGTLIANFLPFVVMILAHFFLVGDSIHLKKVLGLILGFFGVVLLFFDNLSYSANWLVGDCIILGAIFLWGCNVVYIKRIIANFHPAQITIFPMIISIPLFFTASFFFDEKTFINLSPAVITALLYQSLVTASFGFIMWNTLLQKYGATALHSFIFIVPISGVFFGVLILDEPLTLNLIGSIILVVTGLIVVNFHRKPPAIVERPHL